MNNKTLNRLSNVYIFFVAFCTLPLLIFTYPWFKPQRIVEIIFWLVLTAAAEYKPIIIPRYHGICEVSLSFAVHLAMIILLDIQGAILIAIIATFIIEVLSKKPYYKMLFNTGQYGLTLLISGSLFHWLKLSSGNVPLDLAMDIPAILVGVASYFLINVFFVSAVISLTTRAPFRNIFLNDIKIIAGYYYSLATISVTASLIYNPEHPYIILILTPPLIMVDQALQRYYSLHQETMETLTVLAEAIDARDEYTFAHSTRVSEYAKKIAQQMNLSTEQIGLIEIAGKVHDLGKIGIEDSILKKTGKLDNEEREKIQKHPEIAYNLLKKLKPYKTGAIYVLYHHERVDGTGYPHKISDKSIPLQAKILSVADSYDAMTSDRPYRKALPQREAVKELKRCSRTQFDPEIVQAFIEVLKNDYGYKEV
jgi:hypothetical protein